MSLKPPTGLGDAGKRLWKAITGDVGPGWRLDARDLHLLERACRIEDELRELERIVDAEGLTTKGKPGTDGDPSRTGRSAAAAAGPAASSRCGRSLLPPRWNPQRHFRAGLPRCSVPVGEGELMGRLVSAAPDRPLEFEEEIELMCGFTPGWYEGESAFADDGDRRAAYEAHRDRVGGWIGGFAGNRSWAFWRYEADLPEEPEGEESLLWLAEHGHLEPGELSEIAQISADAKARIGTIAEVSANPKTATLYERIREALKRIEGA